MIKILLFLSLVVNVIVANAQLAMPVFMNGTWKVHNKETFEHWDVMHEGSMKGISYTLKDGMIKIKEYLDISKTTNDIIYTAFLYNQNKGMGTPFIMVQNDSIIMFENPDHDFPNRISYKRAGENELVVRVENLSGRGFGFIMHRHPFENKDQDSANPFYDKELALKLGADDYGMKSYFFVILKTGNSSTTDAELVKESFKGHMSNMTRLVEDSKLVVAGPFGKNDQSYRGLFILDNVKSKAEAYELLQSDPAISAGLLDVEIFDWYGSAALPEYLKAADKIRKIKP